MTTRRKTKTNVSTMTAASVSQAANNSQRAPRRRGSRNNTTNTASNMSHEDDGTQMEGKEPKQPVKKKGGRVDGNANECYDQALVEFSKATVATGVAKLVKDFNETRANLPKTAPKTAFDKNPDKNRYKDVICGDDFRVALTWPAGNANDYVHANWVHVRGEKKYICTQGPTSKTIEDFWRLVFQEKAKGIVMLTEVMEMGKKKCEQYWPKKAGESVNYGPVTIKNTKVSEVEKHIISSELEVIADGTTLKCEHVLWTGWPDRGVPDNFLATLRLVRKMTPITPCVVHCSAGIGRTGTIVGLDMAQRSLMAGERTDMHEVVKELRKYRLGSVQTDIQFAFMHAVILRLAENRKCAHKDETKKFFEEYTAFVASKGG